MPQLQGGLELGGPGEFVGQGGDLLLEDGIGRPVGLGRRLVEVVEPAPEDLAGLLAEAQELVGLGGREDPVAHDNGDGVGPAGEFRGPDDVLVFVRDRVGVEEPRGQRHRLLARGVEGADLGEDAVPALQDVELDAGGMGVAEVLRLAADADVGAQAAALFRVGVEELAVDPDLAAPEVVEDEGGLAGPVGVEVRVGVADLVALGGKGIGEVEGVELRGAPPFVVGLLL